MSKFEKMSFYSLLSVVFLIPIAFISPTILALDMVKATIFSLGTYVAFIALLIHFFKNKNIPIPKGPFAYSLFGVVLTFILSGLATLSVNGFYKNFLGSGSETTTVVFAITALVFIYTLVSIIKTKDQIFALFASILLGSGVLALFHSIRLVFGINTLSLGGIFSSQISNTIGQWNDMGVYFGMVLTIAYLGLEFVSLKKWIKIVLNVMTLISLVFLIIVGFSSVWYALGAVSLFVGIYIKKHSYKISYRSITIFIIALIFSFFGQQISNKISTPLNVNQLDVRPSWALSVDLIGTTLQDFPVFGVGPNHYVNQYLKEKPVSINQTVFWSLDFNSGVSYIASLPVMLGGLGIVSIVLLLFILVLYIFKVYRYSVADHNERFVLVAGAGTTLYMTILSILYTPSLPIIIIGLTFFALFIVGLRDHGFIKIVHIKSESTRNILIIKIAIIVSIVLSCSALVFYASRAISSIYFQKALVAANTNGDIALAERYIQKAIKVSERDIYYQALAEVNILKIGQLLSTSKNDETAVNNLKQYLEIAVTNAQLAIKLDPQNYQAYLTQGRVYESVVPAQVTGAYDNATKSYASASSLNPTNPSIFLSAARLEVAMRKSAEAKKFIGLALQAKNNYSDAIFLLSQIQVAENSIKDAITSLLVLAQLNPNEPSIFFQLGLLYYNSGDNVNTVIALGKAVDLNNQYSNARYFLGLALAKLGKYSDAAIQFGEILKLNPDNKEVADILVTLQSGKSPFQVAKTVVASKPEKRGKLPVKDSIDKKTSTQVQTR